MIKFQMYSAQQQHLKSKWSNMLSGQTSDEQSEEEQDILKETLIETSPYLLGLTMFVSIIHCIFEFLAFKNGKQTDQLVSG